MFGKRFIQDVDEAYSRRIEDMYGGINNQMLRGFLATAGGASPSFRRVIPEPDGMRRVRNADTKTYETRQLSPEELAREQRQTAAVDALLRTYSTVPKYAVPAAGLTAAGIGLHELAQQFASEANQQQIVIV